MANVAHNEPAPKRKVLRNMIENGDWQGDKARAVVQWSTARESRYNELRVEACENGCSAEQRELKGKAQEQGLAHFESDSTAWLK